MRTLIGITLTAFISLLTTPLMAEPIVITNAKLWSGAADGTQDNMAILVEDGKIKTIAQSIDAPEGATLIDANQNWVTPGGIAAFSHIGIVEVGAESSSNDISAADSAFSAALSAADSYNPAASPVAVTRIEGVTHMVVAPASSSRIFGGTGIIANSSGAADSIEADAAFTYIEMGISGSEIEGGSRAAAWASLRHALIDAREVTDWPADQQEGYTLSRADAIALSPALQGTHPLVIIAHRASDLRRLIALKADYPALNIIVAGATEAWQLADEIATADISVIIDPFNNLPASFEAIAATSRNAERLIAADVQTAFAYMDDNGHQARLAFQAAGNAVANGVSHDDALRALTITPARMFNLTGHGSIIAGNSADIVIWNGDPLEVTSAPTTILINGELQSLKSRQTRLRDRYLSLDESTLPRAYEKAEK